MGPGPKRRVSSPLVGEVARRAGGGPAPRRLVSSLLAGEVARRAGGGQVLSDEFPPHLLGRWPEGPEGTGPRRRVSSPLAGEVARRAGGGSGPKRRASPRLPRSS